MIGAKPSGDRDDSDPEALVTSYEALREIVLGEQPCGWRLGHGVFASRGMAAWVAAWTTVAFAAEAGATALDPSIHCIPAPPNNTSATAPSSLPGTQEIVTVLAQMALAHS